MSKLALGPTQPLCKWVTGLSPGLNLLTSEAIHLPPSSAKVKNEWSYTSLPIYAFMVHGKAYSLPYLFSLPPAIINTPDSTTLLCPCQHYGISGFHSSDNLHIREPKLLLSPTSLLHNPSWCTPAPLVHMATIPLAQQ